jgi:hypothetical protein
MVTGPDLWPGLCRLIRRRTVSGIEQSDWFTPLCGRAVMIGFIRKPWRRHRVKAAEHRTYLDQEHAPSDPIVDAERLSGW